MTTIIPARIENGQVVPSVPLPPASRVKSLSILIELSIEEGGASSRESTFEKLLGIIQDPGDWKTEYSRYLEERYQPDQTTS